MKSVFYKVLVKDNIRVPPARFGDDIKTAIVQEVKEKYTGFIARDLGIVIDVASIQEVGEGRIIAGDGAGYFESKFELLVFEPEAQEVLPGKIKDIADFGAFLNLGPIDGMIHISQTMNDFVSFTKDKVLQGKDTNRLLKVGDLCYARMVAISFKDPANPKFGLTMRQEGLGKSEWIVDDLSDVKAPKKTAAVKQ